MFHPPPYPHLFLLVCEIHKQTVTRRFSYVNIFLDNVHWTRDTGFAMKISDILKKWRVMSDKTQAEAAQEIGVSRTAYARMESGQMPAGETLAVIICFLLGGNR